MKAAERLEKIVLFIRTHGFATVKELSQQFEVSEMTIRRDLDRLSRADRILRTYGGGAPLPSDSNALPPEPHPDPIGADSPNLICEADVLISTSLNPKYDPLIFSSGGKPKYPIISESVPHKTSTTCVSVDNYQAGFELGLWAGNYVHQHFGGQTHVLNLNYHLPNTAQRSRGFLDGLAETKPLLVSVTSLDPQSRFEMAHQLTRDALEANHAINLIFAINDTDAWGAIHACKELRIDPQKMLVISFGLEGDIMKKELIEGQYCKVALAMFPEIVGKTCVDAAILAYNAAVLPDVIETPYAILTRDTLPEFYACTQTGWELQWDHVQQQLALPAIHTEIRKHQPASLPGCIGILVPFPAHEWYQNLIASVKAYANQSNIRIIVLDAEQNLKDEMELRKREVARRAAQDIIPGDVVFIDGGQVTRYLAEFINKKTGITVITNAIQVFQVLENNPEITLISTGGVLRRGSFSLVGPTAENSLRDMRVDKLFLTVSGVSFDFGLSHTSLSEVTIKQAMIKSARKVILLADHTKFNQESFTQIAPIDVVNTLITDDGLPASMRLQLNKVGIEVITT